MRTRMGNRRPYPCAGVRLAAWLACAALCVWAAGCGGGAEIQGAVNQLNGAAQPALVCNGSSLLCARTYDQVAYPATHNSMSNLEDGWNFPNQEYNIARQLRDGIRGFYLDLHYDNGQVFLCHGYCQYGKRDFTGALVEFKNFMDANPGEVITFVLETYVSAEDAAAAFRAAGLDAYAYTHEAGAPWPTLGAMVRSGQRLVVFNDHAASAAAPWYLYEWAHTWSSPYSFASAEEFTCRRDRGDAANAVFEMPHFISTPLPNRFRAEEVNAYDVFMERVTQCAAQAGRMPTLVSVDYYSLGDLFRVVDAINGL